MHNVKNPANNFHCCNKRDSNIKNYGTETLRGAEVVAPYNDTHEHIVGADDSAALIFYNCLFYYDYLTIHRIPNNIRTQHFTDITSRYHSSVAVNVWSTEAWDFFTDC